MRAQCLVLKAWSQFYKKRMAREMQKHAEIEQAFIKIRGCAGNDDVKDIVVKFMTREQTFTSLVSSVQNLESKVDKLKAENAAKREQLHRLIIENENNKPVGYVNPLQAERDEAHKIPETPKDSQAEHDYKQLSEQVSNLHAHLDQLNERKQNIQLITDQVGGWSRRVAKKLAELLDDHTFERNSATVVH